jgi:hypothetical protein
MIKRGQTLYAHRFLPTVAVIRNSADAALDFATHMFAKLIFAWIDADLPSPFVDVSGLHAASVDTIAHLTEHLFRLVFLHGSPTVLRG